MFGRRRPITERVFIFAIIIFLALTPLAWASTLLNATTTNTSTPTDTTAPTTTPPPTAAAPTTTPPPGNITATTTPNIITAAPTTTTPPDNITATTTPTIITTAAPTTTTPPPTMEPKPMTYIEYVDVYPNAFTPDGDGVDDVMVILAQASEELEWIIYVKKDYGGPYLRKMWGDKGNILKTEWNGLGDNGEKLSDYYIVTGIQTEVDMHQGTITLFVTEERHPETLSPIDEIEICINEAMKELSVSKEEAEKLCPIDRTFVETIEVILTPPPTIPLGEIEGCIDYYQKTIGLTKDEAERFCMKGIDALEMTVPQMTTAPPQRLIGLFNIEDRSMTECYGKLMREPGLTLEDVESLCTAMSINPPKYCAELEENLIWLVQEIEGASKEEQEDIQKDLEIIKKEMLPCELMTETQRFAEIKVHTCTDYISDLEMIFEDMERERTTIKEMIVKGISEEWELDLFDSDVEYERGRLEKMSAECKPGEKAVLLEESPCSKLASLTSIYREIVEIEASSGGEKSQMVTAKLNAIAQEISGLKDRCRKADLTTEDVKSFGDLEKVYTTKLTASIEGASNEGLLEELKAIEEEKKLLMEEFTKNLQELEFKKTTIIQKLKIDGGQVSLDDVKVTIPKIKIVVEGVEIEIRSKDGEVKIVEGGISVTSDLKLEYSDDVLTAVKSGRPIKILPSELKKIVTGEMGEVKLVDDGTPKYIVKSTEDGKLLGIISVTMSKESQINAEDGKIIKETKPWWSFLVLG